jgi:hypothetical protein
MKTITITINISTEEQQPLTIKSSIQEQINFHLKEKELAEKQMRERVKELFKIREEILNNLNEQVGADVWFKPNREETYYLEIKLTYAFKENIAVSLGFRDGIYKNTSFNDWDIYVATPLTDEIVFGEIKYRKPILDKIEFHITPSHRRFKKEDGFGYVTMFTDLSEVHKKLEKDYITYFTNATK